MRTKFYLGSLGVLLATLAYAGPQVMDGPMRSKPLSVKWNQYQNTNLHFSIKLPKSWNVQEKGSAVGFTSPVKDGAFGAMGVMKSAQKGLTIELAAKNDFNMPGRKGSWTQTPARLNGQPAIKVVATPKNDPTRKLIQYYVQVGEDLFLIQCIAPVNQWNDYSALFSTMIRTLQFIPIN